MSLRLPAAEYKKLCRQVLDRDGWRCRNPRCGWRQVSVHHIIFRSAGGLDESWNLVCLCELCHSAVHRYELFIECVPPNFAGIGGGADGIIRFTT